ncbi:hypothetical protein HNS30_01060 [Corallococcus exercitus]|uniref:Uncharacterized protein n=2 Tax=Corallococcus exercitus TaxID=2316736 RepID=A0A7Y4JM82_9BACT|nr:hypothetical protein [Corallococcus exercitus]
MSKAPTSSLLNCQAGSLFLSVIGTPYAEAGRRRCATAFTLIGRAMPLQSAGNFRELDLGSDEEPSIVKARGKLLEAERTQVARYLTTGVVFAVSSGVLSDWFTGEKNIAPHHARTDGVWHWRADLPYYVLRYGVALPEAFLQRMRELDWKCPVLSPQELNAFMEQLSFESEVRQKLKRKQQKEAQVGRALERQRAKK